MDILPRSVREQVNRFREASEALKRHFLREPTEPEIAANMKIDLETCFRLKADANYGRVIPLDHCQSSIDNLELLLQKTINLISPNTPEGQLHVEEVKKILAEEINALQERERQVISLYYLEVMTLKEIGSVLAVTESRISQIHAQAMEKLVKRLKTTFRFESPWEEPS